MKNHAANVARDSFCLFIIIKLYIQVPIKITMRKSTVSLKTSQAKRNNQSIPVVSAAQVKENVRPVSELPKLFRPVFPFVEFNHVQSITFDTIINSNKPVVVSAPTGSGKTGVLELAIVKMLMDCDKEKIKYSDCKVVYLAPTKALCSERREDWSQKFSYLNIECAELTSDSVAFSATKNIQKATILLATPEKWDSITRNLYGRRSTIAAIRLLLIDEVHLINDGLRGATLEAVISRMKILRSIIRPNHQDYVRFIGISATVSNIGDLGDWFSTESAKTEVFQVDLNKRPVKLKTFVLGYNCKSETNDFAFDNLLNDKLPPVIQEYSNQKPTLIFCATRKSCSSTASYLVKNAKLDVFYAHERKRHFYQISKMCHDSTLQETTRCGVAFHHAGLQISDRRLIEQAFLDGQLAILCSTSTLAVGVNLPAHLVIIKNTNYFKEAKFVPYSESSLVQMIGRAGRPQFDTEATAVILTRFSQKDVIQNMLSGNQVVESQLHKFLTEHLNSEIVLGTINEDNIARKWIDATFLRIRLLKCPENYGLNKNSSAVMKENALIDWVRNSVEKLLEYQLAKRNKQQMIESTDSGRAMARHYICLETMTKLTTLRGDETMFELLSCVCSCYEVISDIQVRMEEKSSLNSINNPSDESQRLRFSLGDKIDTKEKKANALLQLLFGNTIVNEAMLQQEMTRISRNAGRVVNCLRDIIMLQNEKGYELVANALILSQCFTAKLWENSIYISKQLDRIGPSISHALAKNGMTTFEALRRANPRNLEIFCNRLPPFGSNVQQTCFGLPVYDLNVRFRNIGNSREKISVLADVTMVNGQDLRHMKTCAQSHECIVLIGNKKDNKVLLRNYLSDMHLLTRPDLTQTFGADVDRMDLPNENDPIEARIISTMYVGLDVKKTFNYNDPS